MVETNVMAIVNNGLYGHIFISFKLELSKLFFTNLNPTEFIGYLGNNNKKRRVYH